MPDVRFEQGRLIANRYLVERELGRGGMGVVYLVRDQQLRGKEVALKLISAELTASPQGRDRFIQEVLAAQELQHPNIIRVFHLDEAAGQCFFTMEYVRGSSLREVVEGRKKSGKTFTLKESASVLNPVLEALNHAHTQSPPVIHRDIKPDNIIVAGDISSPQVKVLDFGLAKMLSPSRLTTTAMTMGTAYYMAPEQVQGARDIDQRADLFSVGVVLYEMLTGRIPSGRFKMPTKLNRELPATVDDIVDKALQQEPTDRFATAREFASVLEAATRVAADSSQGEQKVDVAAAPHAGTAPRSKAGVYSDSTVEEGRIRSSMNATKVISGVLVLGVLALLAIFLMRGEHSLSVVPVSVPASAPIQKESANGSIQADVSPQSERKDEAQVMTNGSAQGPASETQKPRPTGSLLVSSAPDKALVMMDGKELGETPRTVMQVDVGEHVLELSKKFHVLQRIPVEVKEGSPTKVHVDLPRATGALTVTTVPPGATVLLGGKAQAEVTPLTIGDLPAGEYDVVARLAGHGETSARVDVETTGTELELVLEAELLGRLFVNTIPQDAVIRIFPIRDKFEQGMALKPGRYDLRILAPGHVERNETVGIAAGEEKRLDVELQKALGSLEIDSNEAGAEVYLSGARLGTTPGTFSDLPLGRHELRVAKEGFEGWAKEVDILPGKTSLLTASLEKKKPVPGQIWRDPVTGMEFVWVPAGCFPMGSTDRESEPDERDVHRVCVSGFWMGRYEVTNAQYRQFRPGHVSKRYSGAALNGDRQPVVHVSWYDARSYADWLSSNGNGKFRLPTEAEWEYAARSGGKNEKYAGGSDVKAVAWHIANSGDRSRDVGTKSPNGLGLFDMSGNVWEWCEDVYGTSAYVKHSPNNPLYVSDGPSRVIRGGSWVNGPEFSRASNRDWSKPGTSRESLGFRLVRIEQP